MATVAKHKDTCRYFNGITNQWCRAGVAYRPLMMVGTEFHPGALPCIKQEGSVEVSPCSGYEAQGEVAP